MLITGTEGITPIQQNTARRVSRTGAERSGRRGGRYDCYTLSQAPGQEESGSFRELAARLSQQVRTANTTGKIQELRRQVSAGEYQVEPRETAARMLLLMEEGE